MMDAERMFRDFQHKHDRASKTNAHGQRHSLLSNPEIPREERRLIVLDQGVDLLDLMIDAFGAHESVESIVMTEGFLNDLTGSQTRRLLDTIAGLTHLQIVEIDFPKIGSAALLDAVVVLIRRCPGLKSLTLNNLEMEATTDEFVNACSCHPNLKDIKVLGSRDDNPEYSRGTTGVATENWPIRHDRKHIRHGHAPVKGHS